MLKFLIIFSLFANVSLLSASPSQSKNNLTFSPCDEECKRLFSKLRKFATNGSPHAQTLLAVAYRNGDGVKVNSTLSWKWLRRAYRQNFPPALHIASKWFREGYETTQNKTKANEFLEKSAAADFGPAILDLGIVKFQTNQDKQGIELIEKAASKGSNKAKNLLEKIRISQLSKENVGKKSYSESKIFGHDNNLLTITDDSLEPIQVLNDILLNIADTGIYNQKGSTGSRTSDRKCGDGNLSCTSRTREELRKEYFIF